jgi:hypothetical protein
MQRAKELPEEPRPMTVGARAGRPREVTIPEKPVRREDILKTLETDLGTKIYTGRVKGKTTLGFHRTPSNELRIKEANDLEVTAHEITHFLDDRYPSLYKKIRRNKVFAAELRGISYDVKKLKEGFAEFGRLYLTQEEEAIAKAPNFYDYFSAEIERLGLAPMLDTVQEQMHAWFNQGALARFKSKHGKPPQSIRQRLAAVTDRLVDREIAAIFDGLRGIELAERDLAGGLLPAGDSPFKNARLVGGVKATTRAVFQHGTVNWAPNGDLVFTGPGLRQVFEPWADQMDDALFYLSARRANELRGQGREHLFRKDEIEAGLALGKTLKDPMALVAPWSAFNKRMLQFYERSGLLSSETREKFEAANREYIPFHRVRELATGEQITGRRLFMRLKGGTANVADLWENVTTNIALGVDAAVKNHAKLALYNLIDKTPGSAKWAVKIPTDTRAVDVQKDQVERAIVKSLVEQGVDIVDAQAEAAQIMGQQGEWLTFFTFGNAPIGGDIDSVMRKGKREFYQVGDPLLLKAMMTWGPAPALLTSRLMRVLMAPKKLLTRGVAASPTFWARNLVRDTAGLFLLSKGGALPVVDSIRGLADALVKDEHYWQMAANGMGYSASLHGEVADLSRRLEKFYARNGIDYRTILDTPAKVLEAYDELGMAGEYGTRLGEARRVVSKTGSLREGAFAGRDLTDFNVHGASEFLRVFTTVVPYLNARLQGLYRIGREFAYNDEDRAYIADALAGAKDLGKYGPTGERVRRKMDSRVRFGTKLLVGITLPSLYLYWLNKDQEWYQELPDWFKDQHWVFQVAPGKIVAVPIPWEMGLIAKTVPERILDAIEKQYGGDLRDALVRGFVDTLSMNPTPQAVKPPVEIAMNRNFTGAPIIPERLKDVEPWEQYDANTAEVAIRLGKELHVSPKKLEHLIRGYFGTLAGETLIGMDVLFDSPPDRRLDQLPVIRAFYKQLPLRRTKSEDDFYTFASEVARIAKTVSKMQNEARLEDADEYLSEPQRAVLFGARTQITDFQQRINARNAEIRRIRRLPVSEMSSAEKRLELDGLYADRNAMFRDVRDQYSPQALAKLKKDLKAD